MRPGLLLYCSTGLATLSSLKLTSARAVNFDDIFVDELPTQNYIPKIAHFVFAKTKPLDWLEYASIKSAIVNLQAEQVRLWVPPGAKFEGHIWSLVLGLPQITFREIEMPTSVYGHEVKVLAHVSDIVRLEAVYNEGGIYLDYNIIALKSSDDTIYNETTLSTVMARQNNQTFCNAVIMAKAHAPFLRRWMETYRNFDDGDWDGLSVRKPQELYEADPTDMTALDQKTWFNPSWSDGEAGTNKLWFGKSYTDMDDSYGVHQWGNHGRTSSFLTPQAVREIDTPFFCRIRSLFNDVEEPGPVQDWRTNPNCSIVTMNHLAQYSNGLTASYDFHDDTPQKWIDGSGNHLHGWAPWGTGMIQETNRNKTTAREFSQDKFAVLPVPADYDARLGTLDTKLLFRPNPTQTVTTMTLMRLRVDTWSYFAFHLVTIDQDNAGIQMEWFPKDDEARPIPAQSFNVTSRPIPATILSDNAYHTLRLSWDRRSPASRVTISVDNAPVLSTSVPSLPDQSIGREIWLNGVGEWETDTGLRARMQYLRFYHQDLSTLEVSNWNDAADTGVDADTAAPFDAVTDRLDLESPPALLAVGVTLFVALTCTALAYLVRAWSRSRLSMRADSSVWMQHLPRRPVFRYASLRPLDDEDQGHLDRSA